MDWNYDVQLRPTNTSKWAINSNNSKNGGSVPFGQDGIRCPLGTVVVKRITYEDVIQAHRLKSMGSKYSRYVSSKGNNIDLTGYHVFNHMLIHYIFLYLEHILTYNEHLTLSLVLLICSLCKLVCRGWVQIWQLWRKGKPQHLGTRSFTHSDQFCEYACRHRQLWTFSKH